MFLVIWKHVWLNFDCVLTNVKNLVLASTQKKCIFLVFSDFILDYIMSNEGKLPDPKIIAIVNMSKPKDPKDIRVFNGMAQFYRWSIWNFAFIMALITKLLQKIENF
jgi:hypothetical protein